MSKEGEIIAEVKRLRKRIADLEEGKTQDALLGRIETLEKKLTKEPGPGPEPEPDSIDWKEPIFED
jgi:hypothetical protein